MKLEMIYSTLDERIYNIKNNLPSPHENIVLLIIHQISNNGKNRINTEDIGNIFLRKDIRYIPIFSTGVTKNRNVGIENAIGDILLFCDDDVKYHHDIYDIITSEYNNNNIDFATFSYSYDDNDKTPAPKFKSYSYRHNYKSILSVGTIEITCRREKLISNNISFPEDMGAGTELFICDEPVFLSKLLKNKLIGIYSPKLIGSHPRLSSGSIFNNKNAFLSRLLCFTRIFGNTLGRIMYLIFLIKNVKSLHTYANFKNAVSILFHKFN